MKNSNSSNGFILVAFYCPYNFERRGYYKKQRQLSKTMFYFVGPFSHLFLYLGNYVNDQGKHLSINITQTSNGVKVAYRDLKADLERGEYTFYRIKANGNLQKQIIELSQSIQNAYISRIKLYGLNRRIMCFNDANIWPTINQKDWICSELIMFLLQETGVVPKEKNPNQFSPTEVYCYLKANNIGKDLKTKGNSCEIVYQNFCEVRYGSQKA